jgi:hypothetical protein
MAAAAEAAAADEAAEAAAAAAAAAKRARLAPPPAPSSALPAAGEVSAWLRSLLPLPTSAAPALACAKWPGVPPTALTAHIASHIEEAVANMDLLRDDRTMVLLDV